MFKNNNNTTKGKFIPNSFQDFEKRLKAWFGDACPSTS